ncbi:MAG: hypothetical protein EBZ44_01460 [Verrucomicrobia bacterium]|nr:hypothetical protein [Verrucomicrobiota bacterium]
MSSVLRNFFFPARQTRKFPQAFFSRPNPTGGQNQTMKVDRRAVAAGTAFGLLTALGPWFQGLPLNAAAAFAAGLFLTYASIGLLVAILPNFNHRILSGGLIGLIYSIPGAVFTAVPYPLAPEAPAYYREFVGGGPRAFILTLIFGALAGAIAGAFRRRS